MKRLIRKAAALALAVSPVFAVVPSVHLVLGSAGSGHVLADNGIISSRN
ncbi:MAG TPA: hypothetical protein VFU73_14870 [Actinocrinis sp.]|nr:hypothetical protein [Actinocrinis sp.]